MSTFGAALKFCREQAGHTQGFLAQQIGVTNSTVSSWESGRSKSPDSSARMIQEVYQKICALYPMLEFAPRPEFSTRFPNQIKTNKYVEAQEAQTLQARAKHQAEKIIERYVEDSKPKEPDMAEANKHGANFGVLRTQYFALQSKKMRLIKEHEIAITRIDGDIADMKKAMEDADAEAMKAAAEAHGVTL